MVTSGLSDGSDANRGRRWQSETDTLNQYREVEASSIDDGMDLSIVIYFEIMKLRKLLSF